MIFQHHRFQIWNWNQHPYKHNLTEFAFLSEALPGVVNAEQALKYLIGVIYPQVKPAVDTFGELPLVGNTINDYRVVTNDGDGRAAAYRWQQLEGDANPDWYKIYDMDWGEETVLSNFLLKTQDVYAYKYGIDDLDEAGNKIGFDDAGTPGDPTDDINPGDLAGQRIYGGESAGTHLLLYANSGDGAGPDTGFIQFGDDVRPLVDSSHTLGTDTYRFLDAYTDSLHVGNYDGASLISDLHIYTETAGGARTVIEDTVTFQIDFGDTNLGTNGTLGVGDLLISDNTVDRVFITTGTYNLIDFGNDDLTTTGVGTFNSVTATGAPSTFASGTTVGDLTLADGSITSTSATIDFGSNNLSTTGSGTFGLLTVDNIQLDGNEISTTLGNLELAPLTGLALLTGRLDLSGSLTLGPTNNVVVDQNGLTATAAFQLDTSAGGFTFAPNNLEVDFTANLDPTADDTYDLGEAGQRWQDLFISGGISDGAVAILIADLLAFRDATTGANAGDSLFWDNATSRFLPSAPDTEIDHGTISGLLDDDHTQYALLAGRAGGQSLVGGTAAGDDLNLDSTSDGTKGTINFLSSLAPGSDNALDIGSGSFRVRDLYMGGQGIGFRLENTAGLPAAGSNGRAVWDSSSKLYIDDGTTWQEITSNKFVDEQNNTIWDGTATSHAVNVSSQFDDARLAVWQFLDNTNGFRQVQGAVLTKTATTVTINFTIPPASGTYTLVGVG